MPTKTRKEYETVEKEIEYRECDVPGCVRTDGENEIVELAVNPRYGKKETPHMYKKCPELGMKVFKARSDVSFFVCQNCLKNHFEAVPDDYDGENVSEIEVERGRITIKEEYNPRFSIPNWLYVITFILYVISVLWILLL